MDKFVFKRRPEGEVRTVVWPATVTRPLDGGKTVKLLIDVRYKTVDPAELARATSQFALMGRDGNVVVYDLVVDGFPGLPGGESLSDAELIAELRKDDETVRGIAEGYFAMLRGIVPGN